MPSEKLVSILTPCYNSAAFIHRLLDSVLIQTYPAIEMIVIDGGSTDHSTTVVEKYIPQFQRKGYTLTCLQQNNQGQSGAINNGLKQVKGDYLVWPDSDDYYRSEKAIAQLVHALENSPEDTSMVRGFAYLLNEDTGTITGKYCGEDKKDLFEDCLFCRNGFYFCAGAYMARMSAIRKNIPGLNIYTAKFAGQNWQLMLPLLYKQTCLTIPEYIYNIVVRAASHSRGTFITYEGVENKLAAYEASIVSTLKEMPNLPNQEKEHYIQEIQAQYAYPI
ncbi:MAG: glycosyltransferase [Tannerellaceae bacterium]|nr:glycosyltransferase [Tannerellaceae bacterium]